jgi:hypothetical protein
LFNIDSSCDSCVHPVRTDETPLSEILKRDLSTSCSSAKLDAIQDTALRGCIDESCRTGTIRCSATESFCGKGEGVLGFTKGAGFHWMRRFGLSPPIREIVVCSNASPNYEGEGGNTVIHEFAHGCGWNAHGAPIPGIPASE